MAHTATTDPSYYMFTNANPYWYAVGIRPVNLSDNWSMVMYSDAAMTSTLATSAYSYDVDFIVVDGNHTASAAKYIQGYRFSGTSDATVEYEGGSEAITVGTPASYSWTAGDVVQVWDVYLYAGTYVFDLDLTASTLDLDFGLFKSSGAAYHANREARVAGSTSGGNGVDEIFSYVVPSNDWYGLVVWANNANSGLYTLKVDYPGQWLGTVSHDWHNPANWYGGVVPDLSTDVTISPGYTYYPDVSTANASCASLNLDWGARLDVSNYDLYVDQSLYACGALNQTMVGSDIYVANDIYWCSGSTGSMVTGAEFHISDDWTFYGGANVQFTAGTVYFEGTDASNVNIYEPNCRFYNVRPYKAGATLTLQGPDTTYIDGYLILGSSGSLNTASSMPLLVVDDYINNASSGSLHLDHGELRLTGPSYASTFLGGDYVNHLSIGDPGSKAVTNTKSLNSALVVNGNLTINNGTLNPNNNNLYVKGNWANYAGSSGFTEGTGKVILDGATAADILTHETFYNLELDKTFANFNGLEFSDSISVLNALHIYDGTMEMNIPAILHVGGDITIEAGAGLNANDGSGIKVYCGDDFDNLNTTNTSEVGYSPGNCILIMNGSAYQYIRCSTPIGDLEIRSTDYYVYPYYGYPLTCSDLIISEGMLTPNGVKVKATGNCDIHGMLYMALSSDTLDVAGNIKWYSGSDANITNGSIIAGYGWYFYDGTTARLGTGNTVYMRSAIPLAAPIYAGNNTVGAFGNLVIDPSGTGYVYPTNDTVHVLGDMILGVGDRIKMFTGKIHVHGTVSMQGTSKIDEFHSTGLLEIDGNFNQMGQIGMNYGKTLIHGAYELIGSGVLRLNGGSFINDQAYSSSKAFRELWGKLVMSGGLFEIRSNSILIGNSFIDSISGGTIRCGFTFYAGDPNTFQPSGGTFEFSEQSYSGVGSAYMSMNATNYFHHLTVASNGILNMYSDIMVQGDVNITAGPLFANNYTLDVGGNWNNTEGDAGFNEGTGKVRFIGNLPSDLLSNETFYDLVVQKSYPDFEGLELANSTVVNVRNNLDILDGTLEMNPYSSLNVDGDLSISLLAGLNANDNMTQLNLKGDWENLNTSYTLSSGFNAGSGNTCTFIVSDSSYLTSSCSPETFKYLKVMIDTASTSGTRRWFSSTDIRVNADLHDSLVIPMITGDLQLYGDHYHFGQGLVASSMEYAGGLEQHLYGGYPMTLPDVVVNKSAKGGASVETDDYGNPLPLPSSKVAGDRVIVEDNFYLATSSSRLTIQDGTFDLANEYGRIMGGVEVGANGSLVQSGGSQLHIRDSLNVRSGGHYNTTGVAGYHANVIMETLAVIDIASGGNISSRYTEFLLNGTQGVKVNAGALVDLAADFDHCRFIYSPPIIKPPFGTYRPMLQIENSQTLWVDSAYFGHTNPPLIPPLDIEVNVLKNLDQGDVHFIHATGNWAGELHDRDTNDRVHWYPEMELLCSADPAVICMGDSTELEVTINGGMGPFTFAWSPAAGLQDSTAATTMAAPAATTTYQVIVVDQLGDMDTCFVQVIVHPLPTVGLNATDVSLCLGESTTLNASGA
ncbi:MAG TPA: hypothetical protein P5550_08785, partial [Bacteroidales bacterium]|nr:hypothetical protein [Bacteroidales bacterium]